MIDELIINRTDLKQLVNLEQKNDYELYLCVKLPLLRKYMMSVSPVETHPEGCIKGREII